MMRWCGRIVGVLCSWLCRAIAIACVLLLCVLALVLGWLSIEPRNIASLHAPLEQHARHIMGRSDVSFSVPKLYFNIEAFQLEGKVDNIAVSNRKGAFSAANMRLALSPWSLVRMSSDTLGVHVEDIHLALKGRDQAMHIPSIHLSPDARQGRYSIIEMDLSTTSPGASFVATMTYRDQAYLDVAMEYHNFPLSFAAFFAPELGRLEGAISGATHMHVSRARGLEHVRGDARLTHLLFEHDALYPVPLQVDMAESDFVWSAREGRVVVESFAIAREQMRLEGSLHMDVAGKNGELRARLKGLAVDDIGRLWPHSLAQEPRHWVSTHLSDGQVSAGEARLSFTDGVPTLDATLSVEGLTVTYAHHLPPAKDARGRVTFTHDSMLVEVERATSLSESVTKAATVAIPSFSEGAIPIRITLPIEAPAKDVAHYLLALNKAQALGLRAREITGSAKGEIALSFPLYPEKQGGEGASSFDYLDVDIAAQIRDVSQRNVMGAWDVQDFSGKVQLDNHHISLNANGLLQSVPARLAISHAYTSKMGDTSYDVSLVLPAEKFDAFDTPIPAGYVSGLVKMDAAIEENTKRKNINATLDLADAHIAIDAIDWEKPASMPATLAIAQVIEGGANEIQSLAFDMQGVDVDGRLSLSASGEVEKVELSRIHTPQTDIRLSYDATGEQEVISLSGTRLSYATQAPSHAASEDAPPPDVPTPVLSPRRFLEHRRINVALDAVRFHGEELRDVRFRSDCTIRCASLSASLAYAEGAASLQLLHEGGRRVVRARAENVATLLRALDVSDDIRGGSLSFDGAFEQTRTRFPALLGKFRMQDVTVKDAPILTKMLTLASLSGIVDTLTGRGIAFDTIKSTVRFEEDSLTLQQLAAKGDAMGVLLDGVVQPWSKRLSLEGTVIPSYALNSLPGRVPVIGELLVGGEDEGIFGTRFSIRGAVDDPDITVNPLSMLTPGFLRGIFDVFD